MGKRPIGDFKRKTANLLRANATTAEQVLWGHVRSLQVRGRHSRRQVAIGPYVADFACLAERVIIGADGSQHGSDINSRRDEIRTRWLHWEGWRVVRFWNNDVLNRTGAVLEAIDALIAATPPRLPSAGDTPPQGGGGRSCRTGGED